MAGVDCPISVIPKQVRDDEGREYPLLIPRLPHGVERHDGQQHEANPVYRLVAAARRHAAPSTQRGGLSNAQQPPLRRY